MGALSRFVFGGREFIKSASRRHEWRFALARGSVEIKENVFLNRFRLRINCVVL
jgi:hypothetical protein